MPVMEWLEACWRSGRSASEAAFGYLDGARVAAENDREFGECAGFGDVLVGAFRAESV